jgi:glycosyltransferase 2 family protein
LSVAAGDLIVAAACFYILFPIGAVSYADFLGVYLLAIVVVVLSHVPGGVAVFDVIILKMSPVAHKQAVLAAIVLFRVIYYLLPLLAAAALLTLYEFRLRSASFRRMLGRSKD